MFTVLSLTTLIIIVGALRSLSKEAKAQAEIQAELLDLRAIIACKEAHTTLLESELKELRIKLELYSQDLDEVEEKLNAKELELELYSEEVCAAESNYESASSELEGITSKYQTLSEVVTDKLCELRDLLDELEYEND